MVKRPPPPTPTLSPSLQYNNHTRGPTSVGLPWIQSLLTAPPLTSLWEVRMISTLVMYYTVHPLVPALMATLTRAPSPMAGQSYSLTCTLTGGEALTPTITYQFTQDNPGQTGVVGGVLTTPTLTFNPLILSNSGRYSCQATVTSPHLNTPQEVDSGSQSLSIQSEWI